MSIGGTVGEIGGNDAGLQYRRGAGFLPASPRPFLRDAQSSTEGAAPRSAHNHNGEDGQDDSGNESCAVYAGPCGDQPGWDRGGVSGDFWDDGSEEDAAADGVVSDHDGADEHYRIYVSV